MAVGKEIKNKIGSVQNTQKITSAMQMVAAAKLRRAQDAAEASRPYSENMQKITDKYIQKIDELFHEKERDILKVWCL